MGKQFLYTNNTNNVLVLVLLILVFELLKPEKSTAYFIASCQKAFSAQQRLSECLLCFDFL